MKRINPPLTNNINVHYPTDEPNLTHVESLGQKKAHLNFFKPAQIFDTEFVPRRMPHGMDEYLDPTLI